VTPTLALALSHIAPQYNAREHTRAAERMVEDMEKNTHAPEPLTPNERLYQSNSELVAENNRLLAALEELESRCRELASRTEQLDRLLLKGQQPECTLGEVDRANAAMDTARAAIAKAKGVK
jgi:predicted RNase H-like nuclease (RuvC/YqgF family)